jgi:predicted DNA-binding ribbon-helix-helix protein
MLRSMKRLQSPFKRTVVLDGHKTSINVEPEYWDQLRLITFERQTTMAKLINVVADHLCLSASPRERLRVSIRDIRNVSHVQ